MDHERAIDTSGTDETDRATGVQAAIADTFRIGELIKERYSVVTRISEGSTGRLYRARDLTTDSEVTLQLLLGWPRLDDAVIRQLRNELSATQALRGTRSNIAVVLDCELTPDGRAFLVMEPMEGRTLAELIRWREPLSIERAQRLTLRMAEGLHAAHALGLVHGALGAEHVLVQRDDRVAVVGFEVARLRAACRVPALAPSERAEGLTKAADTPAVAMLLLEMLTTGVRPGPEGTAAPLEAPRGGPIPPAVKQLVMQFMVKSPGASSRDMGALARALAAQLDHRPERPISRAWQRRARGGGHRGQWARLAAGALAFVVTASAGWMTWSLVAAPRAPVAHEMPAVPTGPATSGPATSDPPPSGPAPSTPNAIPVSRSTDSVAESPLSPPPVLQADPLPSAESGTTGSPPPSGITAPRRIRRLPAATPALGQPPADPPPAAAAESASPSPRRAVRPFPGSAAPRSEPNGPDPSAIIDWLITNKGDSRPGQPARTRARDRRGR